MDEVRKYCLELAIMNTGERSSISYTLSSRRTADQLIEEAKKFEAYLREAVDSSVSDPVILEDEPDLFDVGQRDMTEAEIQAIGLDWGPKQAAEAEHRLDRFLSEFSKDEGLV